MPDAVEIRWLFVNGADVFGGHEVMLLRWLEELRTQRPIKCVSPVMLARRDSQLAQRSAWCAAPQSLPTRITGPWWTGFAAVTTALRDAWRLARTLQQLRPSLCIVAEGCLMAQPIMTLVARLCGATTVVYVPLVDSATEMGFATGRWRDAVTKYLYVKLPHGWITLSANQARHFAHWAEVRTPIWVLPNTVSRAIEQTARDMAPASVTEDRITNLRVLVLGRLDAPQKGLDLLIDYLDNHPHLPEWLKVTIIGKGPYAAELRSRWQMSQRLREHLTLQDWAEPIAALSAHDVLLLPSRFEGVPLVMLEAMALGVPVVASKLPGTAEALHGDCLFPVADLDAALRILARLRSTVQRAAVAEHNREYFFKRASGAAFGLAVSKLTDRLRRPSGTYLVPRAADTSLPKLPTTGKVVSVVIPSRDGRETLRRALDSLSINAEFIAEVIIVFSNSPPEYLRYCEPLRDEYQSFFDLVLLDSGAGSNGAVARNVGIAAARAPFLAFLDDDDAWLPNKLASYMQFIVNHDLRGNYVVFSSVIECNEDHSHAILLPLRQYAQQPIAEYVLSIHGGAQTSALLLPTQLAQRVGFDPGLIRHQDYDFCMRLEEAGAHFHALPQPLSFWYRRGSGLLKGATFEFCTNWVNANRHRMSRTAFIAYLEKEVLAATRATGRWRDYRLFMQRHLTVGEQVASVSRLSFRAVCKAVRDLLMLLGARKRPSAALLCAQSWSL